MDAAMVESINQIGHLLGLRTIAEFVENDATLEKLRALRVDYAQGYGIHRPEPLDAWDHLAPRRKLEIASA
jgi:EAL domain-containing protein (putative c-di-GMP-specific phosphodiesterase class I)